MRSTLKEKKSKINKPKMMKYLFIYYYYYYVHRVILYVIIYLIIKISVNYNTKHVKCLMLIILSH